MRCNNRQKIAGNNAVNITWLLAIWMSLASPAASQTTPTAQPAPTVDVCSLRQSAAGQKRFEENLDHLVQSLARATKPTNRAQAHLAIANAWLAGPTTHAATACLLGLDAPEDRARLNHAGTQAAKHLEKARALIADRGKPSTRNTATRQTPTPSPEDQTHAQELQDSANRIESFVTLWRAFQRDTDPKARREPWIQAARALARLRESPEKTVAACARCWQAFAWGRAGRIDRAMRVLPPATQPPKTDPYDFFSRLLRCRLLADQEQFAAAAALLIQIRASCDRWYDGQNASALSAKRTLMLCLENQLIANRLTQVRTAGRHETTDLLDQWQRDIQTRLRASFQNAAHKVYVPERLIPLLIDAPAATSPS
jgi:hypothetical protein